MKNTILFCVSFLVFQTAFSQEPTARSVVNSTLSSLSTIKGAIFTLKQSERFFGKLTMRNALVLTKVNVASGAIYNKILSEQNKGAELLYVRGERNGNVRVNPGKYLLSLNLSPRSILITTNQHHTMLNSGFTFVSKILADGVKRADAQNAFEKIFKLDGEVVYAGKKCYKLIAEDPTFKYTTIKASKNDNLYTLGCRLLVSEYHIQELNNIRNFDLDLTGRTLKVPTSYAKTCILYIAKENFVPLLLEMSDENGVFEKYEFSNLQLNPNFKADEFTEKFPEYSF